MWTFLKCYMASIKAAAGVLQSVLDNEKKSTFYVYMFLYHLAFNATSENKNEKYQTLLFQYEAVPYTLVFFLECSLFAASFQVAYVVFDGVFNVGNSIILCCIYSRTCSYGNTH